MAAMEDGEPECIEAIVLASEVVKPKRRRPSKPKNKNKKCNRRRASKKARVQEVVLEPYETRLLDSFIASVPAPFMNRNDPSDPYGIEATLREKRYKSRQEGTPLGARILDSCGDWVWKEKQYGKMKKTFQKLASDKYHKLGEMYGNMSDKERIIFGEQISQASNEVLQLSDMAIKANNMEYERTKWRYIIGLVAGCSALLCLGLFGDRIFGGGSGGSGSGQQQARVASVVAPQEPQQQYVAQAETVPSPPTQPLNQYMPSHEHLRQYIDTCPSGEGNCYFFNCNGETFGSVSREVTGSSEYSQVIREYNRTHNADTGGWHYEGNRCYGTIILPPHIIDSVIQNTKNHRRHSHQQPQRHTESSSKTPPPQVEEARRVTYIACDSSGNLSITTEYSANAPSPGSGHIYATNKGYVVVKNEQYCPQLNVQDM